METLNFDMVSRDREFPETFNLYMPEYVNCRPNKHFMTCSNKILINENIAFRIKFLWLGDECQYFLEFSKRIPNDPLVYAVRHKITFTGSERYLKKYKCKKEVIANGDWIFFYKSLDLLSLYCLSFTITLKPAPTVFASRHQDIDTDLELRGSDGSVHVHKAVFKSHSDLYKEPENDCPDNIQLKEFSVPTLRHLKDYLYLGKLAWLDIEDLINMILFSNRYKLNDLEARCIYQMTKHLTPQNVCEYMQFAVVNRQRRLLVALIFTTPFLGDIDLSMCNPYC